MKIFSKRLKEVLEDRQMTQSELARKINKSQSAVNTYCTGKHEPPIDVFVLICQILDVRTDYMIGLID